MAKAKLKTEKTEVSPRKFLEGVPEEKKKKDSLAILAMMEKASGAKGKMWGPAIIGFGDVYLKYKSGRELDWFRMGFSPRKQSITLYGLLCPGAAGFLKNLGKYKKGKGCLYINSLSDVDTEVLQKLMKNASGK